MASFVADSTADEVSVFKRTANGDVAPAYVIAGSNTHIDTPVADAVDGSGLIYVLNASSYCVFPPGARGNAPPRYFVSGALTQLSGPQGLALDAAGDVYVSNLGGGGQADITVYVPGSNGDRAPVRTIFDAQNFLIPAGIAVFGTTLYVADQFDQSINEYPANSNGQVFPTRMITGLSAPKGVAVDSTGHIFVTDGNSVLVFAAGANGNAKPVRTISGSNTLLDGPNGLFVGLHQIQVANAGGASITVYPRLGNGDIAPVRTISGGSTGLASPQGVAVH